MNETTLRSQILVGMSLHSGSSEVQLYSCWCLVEISAIDLEGSTAVSASRASFSSLSCTEPPQLDTLKEDSPMEALTADTTGSADHGVISAVIAAIKRHRAVADVCRYGTKALENLASASGIGI